MRNESKIIIVSNFHANKLNNDRRLFIYLPRGYEQNEHKRYQVLYMHAGQRAFDPVQPGTESWNIHKAADRLIADGLMEEIIIVAIAHVRPTESNEFYHFTAPNEELAHIKCSGLDYEDFIIHDLKPYIDERFRTLTEPRHTALLGSSAGALSTYNIGFRNPHIFGKLMMLSPYFVKARLDEQSDSGLFEETIYDMYEGKPALKIWMDIGDAEGLFLPRHVRGTVDELIGRGYRYGDEIGYLLQPEAAHQERDWGERVHIPLLYMFGTIGKPVALELIARDDVGLQGMSVSINALVHYDSGFVMSELEGTYIVEHPDVLEVTGDGVIIPKAEGVTNVTLIAHGLQASRQFTVIKELSHLVCVRMSVKVPSSTPDRSAIYGGMGMKLETTGNLVFEGQFMVPRDSGYQFRFTRGFRMFEVDAEGNPIRNRCFRADKDVELHYEVEQWEGLGKSGPERKDYADTTF
ncbi:esterase [Paenibacillus oenotherae]|uniref:Esterase n=1 Tax=Paenibacillus oenotherae TaxID=1435645 RepID=A0ABS7CZV7_9BACL|nr:alpha/beta hydrolase-fold protein [Paenibacillus oenotherae]MBW7473162.1 esterase [Paenibacillus oenotherae]